MKEILLVIAGGVVVYVLLRGSLLGNFTAQSVPSAMSAPVSGALQKFANALNATGPVPQSPKSSEVQAIPTAQNYVNPAAQVGTTAQDDNSSTNPNSQAYAQAASASATENASFVVLTPPAQGLWGQADANSSGYAENKALVDANVATGQMQIRLSRQEGSGDLWIFSPAGWFQCASIQGVDKIQGTENDRQLWFSLPVEMRQKAVSLCHGGG